MFGRIPMATASRGEFFLFYSYEHVSGAPLLAALVSGAAAREFEEQQPSESVARLMTVLRGWFEPRGVSVPEPLQVSPRLWLAGACQAGQIHLLHKQHILLTA